VDGEGRAYVTGFTASADFPTTPDAHDSSHNGGNDAFVATFDRFSTLAYSTFLGGTGGDAGIAVAVGADRKRAYVTGSTSSADFAGKNDRPAGAKETWISELEDIATPADRRRHGEEPATRSLGAGPGCARPASTRR
jgi:hypothetical protein